MKILKCFYLNSYKLVKNTSLNAFVALYLRSTQSLNIQVYKKNTTHYGSVSGKIKVFYFIFKNNNLEMENKPNEIHNIDVNSSEFYDKIQTEMEFDMARMKKSVEVILNLRCKFSL